MPIFSTKRAACTRVGYARNFAAFQQWCADHDESPLPASREAILGYVRGLRRSLSRASIHVRLAAINAAHYDQKKTAPIDMRLWGDIARALKSQRGGERKKFSLVDGDLSRLLATCKGETPKDLRDRAIILCSRHGALTISEVSALSLADLHWTDRGCVLRIDPERELVRIDRSSLCPVRALERWLAVDGHATGRVFHSVGANGVYRMIERRLKAAKLDLVKYSHISLRFGMWVDLASVGKDTREIARTYGASVKEVAEILDRHGV